MFFIPDMTYCKGISRWNSCTVQCKSQSFLSNHKEFSKNDRQSTFSSGKMEEQRKIKMARLRAENEAEERKMAALDEAIKRNESDQLSGKKYLKKRKSGRNLIIEVNEDELKCLNEMEQMEHLLGFAGRFSSTSGKMVDDNQRSASKGIASKNKARKYRQYMNRKGGFNRPLQKMI